MRIQNPDFFGFLTILYKFQYIFSPGLLSAGAMGLWHGVEYYEKEKMVGEEYYQQWSNVSQLKRLITSQALNIK